MVHNMEQIFWRRPLHLEMMGSTLKNAKVYHPEDELAPMYKMKYFLDNVWYSQGRSLPNIGNTEKKNLK